MNYLLSSRFKKFLIPFFGCMIVALMAFKDGKLSLQESDVNVTLKMESLKPQKSVIFVAVFDNSDTFLDKNRFKSFKIESSGETSVSKVISLPQGTYAMAVFQDLNENEKLDKNFIGIPTEPYSFSNGAAGRFGPPSWEEARVIINKETVLKFKF